MIPLANIYYILHKCINEQNRVSTHVDSLEDSRDFKKN